MSFVNVEFLRKIERLDPDLKDVLYPMVEELEKPHEEITRIEFSELKAIVKDLARAQERTGQRMEELASAQQRTEKRMEELVSAQQRTEKRMEELVSAQQRTEKRVEELTLAQQRTEKRMEELASAQENTEKRMEELAKVVKNLADRQEKMNVELGGLGTTIGYTLENEAYKKLPALLEADFGIKIKQRLNRKYVSDFKGNSLEVNIFGYGEKQGKEVTIIGESKAQLSNNKVDEFLRKKVKPLDGLFKDVFLVLVTHMITGPEVEDYVKNKGIALYYSYDF
ncbi:MAG: DUF4175 domain-containing protein [Acidobacteria bacterium]|nr:DUF4175 domain-containing protein [Acidobacteriota bacterium]